MCTRNDTVVGDDEYGNIRLEHILEVFQRIVSIYNYIVWLFSQELLSHVSENTQNWMGGALFYYF